MASALTADFDSPILNVRALTGYVAATGTVIYRGGLVQINSSGLATAAVINSSRVIVGRAATAVLSTDPAGTIVMVEEGDIYLDADPSGSGPVQATVGAVVYARSDHEVSTSSNTGSCAIAGFVTKIQSGPYGASGAIVRCTLEATT